MMNLDQDVLSKTSLRAEAWDLSRLRARLLRQAAFQPEDVDDALRAYREFLTLKVASKDEDAKLFSPPLAADRCWHAHILDTRDYAAACRSVLGYEGGFLHHDADGAEDVMARAARVVRTKVAAKEVWGEVCMGSWRWAFDSDEERARKRKRTDTPLPAPSCPSSDTIELKVSTQDGNEVYFKLRMTTPLSKLMNAFCDRQGFKMRDVRFCSGGDRITPEQTPEDLRLNDGDTIDVMIEQGGC